tara:strand:+ start:3850 stop:4326 length:477 start_codon:yes stop_codon:yes gene_type:complete
MQGKLEIYKNVAYTILAILFIIIIFSCFNYQTQVVQNLAFRGIINRNSNVEGFTSNNLKKNDYKDEDLSSIITNKLKALNEEIGGSQGTKDVKKLLTDTKKVINLECAKCMMSMLDDNKSGRTMDFEKLLDDDNDENCSKCKKYTELSSTITSMIDNL